MAIYLASNSPRRIELLSRKVPKFEHFSRGNKEKEYPNLNPREKAIRRSKDKCLRAISKIKEEDMVIISGDTVVDINGIDLGKPKDEADAYRMIKMLSGESHYVHTAMSVYKDGIMYTFCDDTMVFFDVVPEDVIREYIKTDEPYDKAGGYAIQGFMAKYILNIRGDYNTVVGMPVDRVYNLLRFLKVI